MSDPSLENGAMGVDDETPMLLLPLPLPLPPPSPMSAVSAARASIGSDARGLRGEPPMPVGEAAGGTVVDGAAAVPKLESPNGSAGAGATPVECA